MSSLFWGVRQCWLRFSYRRFGTVYRSYLQGSNSPRRMPGTVHCVVFFSWLLHPHFLHLFLSPMQWQLHAPALFSPTAPLAAILPPSPFWDHFYFFSLLVVPWLQSLRLSALCCRLPLIQMACFTFSEAWRWDWRPVLKRRWLPIKAALHPRTAKTSFKPQRKPEIMKVLLDQLDNCEHPNSLFIQTVPNM